MGSQQGVFGCDGVYAFVSFVVSFPYRVVDFRKLSQFFQIIVHLLIADDRKCLMVFKVHAFVFIQYRLAVVVQLYDKTVRSLDGGHFYMVGLDVAPFEVVHVRIAQPAETAEQKDIPDTFQILFVMRYMIIFQFVQFIPCQEYYLFRGLFSILGLNASYAMF